MIASAWASSPTVVAWRRSPVSFGAKPAHARVRALQDQPQSVTGQHPVPHQIIEGAIDVRGVAFDHLVNARQPRGHNRDRRCRLVRPRCEQVPEVQQRITKGDEFPVDDGGERWSIGAHQDVAEVEVAMHQPWPNVCG